MKVKTKIINAKKRYVAGGKDQIAKQLKIVFLSQLK